MAASKTMVTMADVAQFIAAVPHPGKRADAAVLDALLRKVTGEVPAMWGATIVGYGQYHYVYDSGREGAMCRVGFSPRKAKHSLYLCCDCDAERGGEVETMLARLGKYSQGSGGCLYVNKLADIDLAVLEEMIAFGWARSHERWP